MAKCVISLSGRNLPAFWHASKEAKPARFEQTEHKEHKRTLILLQNLFVVLVFELQLHMRTRLATIHHTALSHPPLVAVVVHILNELVLHLILNLLSLIHI